MTAARIEAAEADADRLAAALYGFVENGGIAGLCWCVPEFRRVHDTECSRAREAWAAHDERRAK